MREGARQVAGDPAGFLFESGARAGLRLGRPRLSGEPGDVGTAGTDGSVLWAAGAVRAIVWQVVRVEGPPSFVSDSVAFPSKAPLF